MGELLAEACTSVLDLDAAGAAAAPARRPRARHRRRIGGLGGGVEDARAAVEQIDQDAYERRLRSSHSAAAAADVVAAVRAARREVADWLGSPDDDRDGLTPTASPLGALPVRTFLHAAVYQLAVVALDLEPCAAEPVPPRTSPCGPGRARGLRGVPGRPPGVARQPRRGHAGRGRAGADAVGVWGFGTTDGAWRVAELGRACPAAPR